MNEVAKVPLSRRLILDSVATWWNDDGFPHCKDQNPKTHDGFARLLLDEAEPFTPRHNEDADDPSVLDNGKKLTLSPSSVRDYGMDLFPTPKRFKMSAEEKEDERQLLPNKPVKRQHKRTRPICTFLNYFGSRLASLQTTTSSTAATSLAAATAAAAQSRTIDTETALALFPVCTCKLRHQVLNGCVKSAPPILDVLSRVCQARLSSTPADDGDSHLENLKNPGHLRRRR